MSNIFLTLAAAVYLSGTSAAPSSGEYEVCQSQTCKDLAKEYLISMDPTADPCTDFYQYACGNYGKTHRPSKKAKKWSRFAAIGNKTYYRLKEILESKYTADEPVSVGKAKQLYRACMDEQTIESRGTSTIHYYLNLTGGWPILTDPSRGPTMQKPWQSIDSYYNRLLGKSPIANVFIFPKFAASDNKVIMLLPPSSKTPSPIRLTADLKVFANLIASFLYKDYITDVVKVMARTGGFSINDTQVQKDVMGIIKFERALTLISLNKPVNQPANQTVNQTVDALDVDFSLQKFVTIAEAQAIYDATKPQTSKAQINWLQRIKDLFAGIESVAIDDSERIDFTAQTYFKRLAGLLDITPERDIVNAIHWWFVKQTISYTSKEMSDLANSYERKVAPGTPSNATTVPSLLLKNYMPNDFQKESSNFYRWFQCVTGNELQHALSYPYVQKYFSDSAKNVAVDMIHEIEAAMKKQISQATWMDNATKEASQEKIANIIELIGYPDWYEHPSKLDERYENLTVGPFYLENMLLAKQYGLRRDLESLKKPVDKSEWAARPYTTNAFYAPNINSITLPAGILQMPFFNAENPETVNYGAIGFFISHEISHAFDSNGSQIDKNGNVARWWSNITLQEYSKKTQCFVDQFNHYQVREGNVIHQNFGVHTADENIADSTGLSAAFEAYKVHKQRSGKKEIRLPDLEYLTKEQLFFLSFAENFCEYIEPSAFVSSIRNAAHSIGPYRVNGTLANTEAFAESFKCPKGSNMNPTHKCVMWAR